MADNSGTTVSINAPMFFGGNLAHGAGFYGVWPDVTIRRPEWGNWGAGLDYVWNVPTGSFESEHSFTLLGYKGPHDVHPQFHILGAHTKYFLNPWGKDLELTLKSGAGVAIPYDDTLGEKVLREADESSSISPSFFAGASLAYWLVSTDQVQLSILTGGGATFLLIGDEPYVAVTWNMFSARF